MAYLIGLLAIVGIFTFFAGLYMMIDAGKNSVYAKHLYDKVERLNQDSISVYNERYTKREELKGNRIWVN